MRRLSYLLILVYLFDILNSENKVNLGWIGNVIEKRKSQRGGVVGAGRG